MSKVNFSTTPEFLRSVNDVPKEVGARVWRCLDLLSKNPRHPGLNVEALRGQAQALYSARVSLAYRLIFLWWSEQQICLLYVGPEQDAYRYADRTDADVKREAVAAGRPAAGEGPAAVVQLAKPAGRKYLPLSEFLARQQPAVDRIDLGFDKIQEIIKDPLPPSALKHAAWWANDRRHHAQAAGWLAVGWTTTGLSLEEKRVSFVRSR